MKHTEKGVLENSTMCFHTPSTAALQHLFFLNYVGYFHCNSNYRISRSLNELFEPYLFLLVLRGKMQLDYKGQHYEASSGECLFFDCRLPHCYYTTSTASFQYVHFGGNLSDYYYQRICGSDRYSFRAQNPEALSSCLSRLEEEAEQKIINEHIISAHIHMLLSLTLSSRENYASENSGRIAKCINYMKEHIHQSVTLQDLSDYVSLSPYYLSRLFKRYTDSSPGEYLMNLRLSHAKMLLITTSRSVTDISEMCGFQSSAHFIGTFRKRIGITPLQFRKTHTSD
ncbi:MAG: helix-turn-helix domain-containing protein [Ruminococcus sp.]|jgi:AraC family transcriptional regulator